MGGEWKTDKALLGSGWGRLEPCVVSVTRAIVLSGGGGSYVRVCRVCIYVYVCLCRVYPWTSYGQVWPLLRKASIGPTYLQHPSCDYHILCPDGIFLRNNLYTKRHVLLLCQYKKDMVNEIYLFKVSGGCRYDICLNGKICLFGDLGRL